VQHVQQRKNAGVRDRMVLVTRARLALEKALTHGSEYHYSNTNAALYDKFVKIYAKHQLSHTYNAQKYAMDEFHRAQLDLWHPTRPLADNWYDLISRDISDSDGAMAMRELLQNPKSSSDTAHYIKTFARAARLMKTAGKDAESAQLVTAAQTCYPDKISQVAEVMQDLLTSERHSEQQEKRTEKEQHEHQHQHNWLSHYFPAPT
jgi:MoxR-like ATPase